MNVSSFSELTLNEALKLLDSSDIPNALPLLHTTTLGRIDDILSQKSLSLCRCSVFSKELLYLFYGGPYYRPKCADINNKMSYMPVVFMLRPSILKDATCFFPYDTGATEKGVYGDHWSPTLGDFEKFRMNGDEIILAPRKFIRHVFGDNQKYINGELLETYRKLPIPIPMLGDFYSEMSEKWKISGFPDTRRWKIECHFDKPIPLKDNVLWIGYPKTEQKDLIKFHKALGDDLPKFEFYRWKGDRSEERIVYDLEDKVINYLEEYRYLLQ